MKQPLRIGLTGGIGSGKSTAAKRFSELGIDIIDADQIARELLEKDEKIKQKIIDHFGDSILDHPDHINRKKLSSKIFSNPEEKKWLESLLHPVIFATIKNETSACQSPYCIIAIPLLIETQAFQFVDRILVIDTPEDLQIQRTMARDNISREKVEKIMSAQSTRQERFRDGDDIIINDGSLEKLHHEISLLHQKYLKLVS